MSELPLCFVHKIPTAVSCFGSVSPVLTPTFVRVQMIGRQDPYMKLWVGRAGTKVKTRVHVDGGKYAKWDETFMFILEVCARERRALGFVVCRSVFCPGGAWHVQSDPVILGLVLLLYTLCVGVASRYEGNDTDGTRRLSHEEGHGSERRFWSARIVCAKLVRTAWKGAKWVLAPQRK